MHQHNPQAAFPKHLQQNYIIEKQIGEGAYGKVWKGQSRLTKQPVAVKGYFDIFRDHVDAKRMLREISILRQISDHQHIIKLIDVICPDNIINFQEFYIVLEYCPYDLKTFIRSIMRNQTIIPITTVLKLMYQILKGLKACKVHHVFHRDIKPANILMYGDDSQMGIKLCDFGLARGIPWERKEICKNKANVIQCKREINVNQCQANNSLSVNTSNSLFKNTQERQGFSKIKQIIPQKVKIVQAKKVNNKTQYFSQEPFKGGLLKDIQLNSNKSSRVKGKEDSDPNPPEKSDLTKHLVTRWYRSPEIILLQDHDFKSDIWSAGCILAELLGLTNGAGLHGPLFPGRSCYPMSPMKKQLYNKDGQLTSKEIIVFDVNDQLNLIMNIIGTPFEESIDFITGDDIKEYVRAFDEKKIVSLKNIYPEASDEVVDLLVNMLRFNPKERYSVDQCLEHSVFASFEREIEGGGRLIYLDYDHGSLHLSSNDIRALLMREVNYFNKIEKFEYLFGFLIIEITGGL